MTLTIPFDAEDQALTDAGTHPVPYDGIGIAISGANEGHVALRAQYWMIQQIPFREVTDFLRESIEWTKFKRTKPLKETLDSLS